MKDVKDVQEVACGPFAGSQKIIFMSLLDIDQCKNRLDNYHVKIFYCKESLFVGGLRPCQTRRVMPDAIPVMTGISTIFTSEIMIQIASSSKALLSGRFLFSSVVVQLFVVVIAIVDH